MSFQKSTFFSVKYNVLNSSSKLQNSLSDVELAWAKYYVLSDGRLTFRSKRLLKNFFGDNLAIRSSNRSLLRSQCLASGVKRGVTAYSFWLGRHSLNERFKRGWVPGFRKC